MGYLSMTTLVFMIIKSLKPEFVSSQFFINEVKDNGEISGPFHGCTFCNLPLYCIKKMENH
jgi:hypothetical protein